MLINECGVALETPDIEHGRTAAHWATYYHKDDILAELIIAGTCKLTTLNFQLSIYLPSHDTRPLPPHHLVPEECYSGSGLVSRLPTIASFPGSPLLLIIVPGNKANYYLPHVFP